MSESVRIGSISDNRPARNREHKKRHALVHLIFDDGYSGFGSVTFPPHQAEQICAEIRRAAGRAKKNRRDFYIDIELQSYEDSQ